MFIDEFGSVNLLNYPFESSVHPSIIDAPKGMAIGFSVFSLGKSKLRINVSCVDFKSSLTQELTTIAAVMLVGCGESK